MGKGEMTKWKWQSRTWDFPLSTCHFPPAVDSALEQDSRQVPRQLVTQR